MSSFAAVAQQIKLDILSKTYVEDNDAKRKEIARTFISDTITVPTKEMYEYATLSTMGDDVYFEPSTKALEAHVAKITGKEAGLFVPSGTASNQIAIRTHLLQPPYSVLCDHRAHIQMYEAGGAAFHSGAAVSAVIPSNGHHLTLDDVKRSIILGSDTHLYLSFSCSLADSLSSSSAPTEVVALENTLNGTIFPQDEIIAISDYVHSQGKKMHLDGARLWHVAAETETPLKELCDPFDSVSAPIGSCLVGSTAFIAKARWFRKLFGGGMRQTGILAASAAYALTYNFPLLPGVHDLARRLETQLEEIGVEITSRAETCMIFYDPASIGVTYDEIADRASDLPEPLILGGSRLVLHIQTSESAVNDFLSVVRQLAEEKKAAGFVKPPPAANGNSTFKNVYVRRVPKTSA
ncbi:Beta-elim-lyase domain-containing protein [Mycena venus]|uniref:Beta-elim-lyase domain-containing protein n=1 Tax=Mycena venus TaxID=2733690 RepID=A0A8H6XED0_9AGAR|nr:Beta-elim-lyase domain-containing protein [Mycena venus]